MKETHPDKFGASMKRSLEYNPETEHIKHIILVVYAYLVILWSVFNADDPFAWLALTMTPVVWLTVMILTYRFFKFTTFTYQWILFHIIILQVGAQYRYYRNPFFGFLKVMLDLNKNYFDRFGHFLQGFVPMFMIKELFLRRRYMKRTPFFFVTAMAFGLAISATWEISEFIMAQITGKSPEYIMTADNYSFDTYWDMILAVIGGATALFVFGRKHDRHMEALRQQDEIDDIYIK